MKPWWHGWRLPKRGRWRYEMVLIASLLPALPILTFAWLRHILPFEILSRWIPFALLPFVGITTMPSPSAAAVGPGWAGTLQAPAVMAFNVKAGPYGAKGNGVSNEEGIINRALADAGAQLPNPGAVWVPPGNYLLGAPLLIPSGVLLWLDPQATLIRNFAVTTGGLTQSLITNSLLSTGAAQNTIEVRGGAFTLPAGQSITGYVMSFRNVDKLKITHCRILNFYNAWGFVTFDCTHVLMDNLYVNETTGHPNQDGIHIEGGSDIAITNSILITGDDSIALVQETGQGSAPNIEATTDLVDVVISNCRLNSAVANGLRIDVETGQAPSTRNINRIVVTNCSIVGGNAAGGGSIAISDVTGSGKITDIGLFNIVCNAVTGIGPSATLYGITRLSCHTVKILNPSGPAFMVNGCTDVVLDDCESTGTRGVTQSSVLVGTFIAGWQGGQAGSTNLKIIGGHYKGATNHGLQIGAAAGGMVDCQIIGTTIESCTNDGINLTNLNAGGLVEGCRCKANGGYGVNITAASSVGVHIFGNDLHANTTGSINDLGTATLRARNRVGAAGALQGTAVLVGGTVIVATAEVTDNRINLTRIVTGGTVGHLTVGAVIAGTSFVITSSSGTDTSTIYWELIH